MKKPDQDAVRFYSFQRGLMDNFYGSAFAAADSSLHDEAQQWADEMNSSRATLVTGAYALAVGDPGAEVAMATEKGQELAAGLLEDWIHEAVDVTPQEAPKDLVAGIKGLEKSELDTAWPSAVSVHAASLAGTDATIETLSPVTLRLPGEAAAHTYTGNPYGGGGSPKYVTGPADDFVAVLRKYGGQEGVAKMTPRQLGAYSRWVQDPAVVARLVGRGAFDSVLGRAVGG